MIAAQQSAMQEVANRLPTCRLLEAVRFIGGTVLPPPENMARAALLTAYQAREGDDALDTLMDEIGL